MDLHRVLDSAAVVGGAAITINGFAGKPLLSDVEMPLTKEDREDPQPATRSARAAYIFFGILLCTYGVLRLLF